MNNNKIQLHRVLKASPEKVFRAFSDSAAYASWIPPFGFICEVDHMNFSVGGSFKMAFKNFSTGKSESFGGKILAIKPNEMIQYQESFDDPNLPGEMLTTIYLKEVLCGTDLSITQEGIPAVIPLEMCYLGWQESLEKLMKLVEPEIPDA